MADYNRLLDPVPARLSPMPYAYGFIAGVIFCGATLFAVEWFIR